MTVSTTQNRITYNGDALTLVFSFPYKFIETSDLVVYVDEVLLVESVDYSVGTPSDAGANVTFISAPDVGVGNVIIYRDPDLLQTTDLPTNGRLPADAIERMSDKLTLIVQRLSSLLSRSLTLSDSDSSSASTVLPSPQASTLIGWNAAANALVNFTSVSSSLVSAYMETVLQAANAAAARALLVCAGLGANTFTGLQTFSGGAEATDIDAGTVIVDDDAYNATTWNGNNEVPTKNSIRDKIESLSISPIFDIDASVSSNALTITINPDVFDFRSTTLTDGTPTTVALTSAVTVVVPSGGTLGTINAIAARLAVIAINNAGTIEAAVINLSGGNNLDETGLISTTTVGTGSDSATVAYSTTGRSNVAYRVVGFIDITEATAGTWATAPTLVQGAGGNAMTALSSLGYGQTWQNLTGSRASATTYYNTTGKPIEVAVTGGAGTTSSGITVTVNSLVIFTNSSNDGTAGSTLGGCFIVPAGNSYSVTTAGALSAWYELR